MNKYSELSGKEEKDILIKNFYTEKIQKLDFLDFLDWKGIHIKDYFLEKEIKSFLIRNNLLDLVANYYKISFPELRNKKLDEFLIK